MTTIRLSPTAPKSILVRPNSRSVVISAAGARGAKGDPGDPATSAATVTDARAYGLAPAVGVSSAHAREDHTHGTPALGTSGSTAAAGNDSRITGATQKTANLSDLASTATALANLGIPDASALYPGAARLPRWVQPSNVITTFQSGHGWTSSGTGAVANLNDTSDFLSGFAQAAKITTGANGLQANIRKFAGSAFDTTGRVIRIRVKIDDITHLGELIFFCGSSSLANNYKWSIQVAAGNAWVTSGDWCTVTLSFADATTAGSATRTGVTDWQLQILDDGNAPVTAHIQSVELIPDGSATFPNGVVSFCFDDSWSSARDNAFGKLLSVGCQASLYTINDQLGSANHITAGDIKTLVDRFGWESAAHAFTDADHAATYTGLTAAQLETDLRAQRASLLATGIRGTDGSAYPLGQFGRTSDNVPTTDIVRRYFSYVRTTANRTTETWPPADPYRLRAVSSISTFAGGNSPSSLTTAGTGRIAKAKANSAWLILVFHKIVTGAVGSTLECSQADFNSIVDAVITAGVPVLPVGDVLRYYG